MLIFSSLLINSLIFAETRPISLEDFTDTLFDRSPQYKDSDSSINSANYRLAREVTRWSDILQEDIAQIIEANKRYIYRNYT